MAVLSNTQKMQISAFQALLFYVLANPITFSVIDRIIVQVVGPYTMFRVAEEGKPTGFGLLLHASVFFAVTWGLMYV